MNGFLVPGDNNDSGMLKCCSSSICYLGRDLSYQVFLIGVRYFDRLPVKLNLPQNCALRGNRENSE